jgi:hypothetical protein
MGSLQKSNTVAANAAGKAVCQVQPLRAFERWRITNLSVSSTSTNLVPTVKLYRNSETPSALIDGSYTGTFNSRSDETFLEVGERLLAVFEGSDVGALCTVTITGETVYAV